MNANPRRIVVAGTSSGARGKTSVACRGLNCGRLRRAAVTSCRASRSGPDYIEPELPPRWHPAAPGPQPTSTRFFLVRGPELIAAAVPARVRGGADVAVVEGVMGPLRRRVGPAASWPSDRAHRSRKAARRAGAARDRWPPRWARSAAAIGPRLPHVRPPGRRDRRPSSSNKVGSGPSRRAAARGDRGPLGVPVVGALRGRRPGRASRRRSANLGAPCRRSSAGARHRLRANPGAGRGGCLAHVDLDGGAGARRARRRRAWAAVALVGPFASAGRA